MKKLLIILTVIVSFILFSGTSSCEHKSPTAATELECVPGSIEFETVTNSYGIILGDYQIGVHVIYNQSDYETFCGTYLANQYPVDFNNKILIADIMGQFSNQGYSTEITLIETDCESITVKIHNTYPVGPINLPAGCNPKHLATIDKTDLPINFIYE